MNAPILYLPGFNSGPQSAKSQLLKQAFPHLIAASYNTWDPDHGFQQLEALIAPFLGQDSNQNPILVGSSLGGFWSYHLACKHDLKCVLLNPCMTPEKTLKPYIGEVLNRYSGETGYMGPEALLKYENYRFDGNPVCTVLHQRGDELISYQESVANFQGKARLILLEGGSHEFEALPTAMAEIEAICALKHRNDR